LGQRLNPGLLIREIELVMARRFNRARNHGRGRRLTNGIQKFPFDICRVSLGFRQLSSTRFRNFWATCFHSVDLIDLFWPCDGSSIHGC
jgi:hypothetical protein